MTLKAMITDPEVVFVANLTKADAPALTASFQCNLSLSTSKLEQMMEASVRDLKVLACPFLRERRGKSVTTVRKTVDAGSVTSVRVGSSQALPAGSHRQAFRILL